jgi:hypothetical protein
MGTTHEPEPNKDRLEFTRDLAILQETIRLIQETGRQALKQIVELHEDMKTVNPNLFPVKAVTKWRWERDVERIRLLMEQVLGEPKEEAVG